MASTYVNTCAVCGAVTIGPERRFVPDGPPIGFCDYHGDILARDANARAIYCIPCKRVAYLMHIQDYDGEKILFADDCPNCNSDFTQFRTRTWKAWMSERSSRNSSPPDAKSNPSMSTGNDPADSS